MRLMSTAENPTDPIGEFISAQQTIGLDHLSFAVDPFGLYGVQPRALLGQQAAYDPDPTPALFDLAVMLAEPAPDLAAYVPAGIVPDEEQELLTNRFKLLTTPSEEPSRYAAHRAIIQEPYPRLIELRQIEPVTRDG